MMLEQLSYLHGAPVARGILKAEAADFVVNEDLGFEPCGEGEHIFVRVRKPARTLPGWRACWPMRPGSIAMR